MIDLDPNALSLIKDILKREVPGITVKAFGSRVTGKAKAYSDLDLVLIGAAALSETQLQALRFAFSDSDLPIMIDVVDWHAITDEFREVINGGCETLIEPCV